MGLNYGINLYFPASALELAFQWLARIGPLDAIKQTPLQLPDGRSVILPFTANWKNDPVALLHSGEEVHLETSLLFAFDDAIVHGDMHYHTELIDGRYFAEIGHIYLTVRLGCLYAEFWFLASTSRMSRLFVTSQSIRRRLRELLDAAGGVAGSLDKETGEFYSLEDPSNTFAPVWAYPPSEDRLWSTDYTAIGVCRGLGKSVPGGSLSPLWRTPSVVGVAGAIHEERAFDQLPILADALEDAGCDDADLLEHCRRAEEHVRDCWVVDLVLSQS